MAGGCVCPAGTRLDTRVAAAANVIKKLLDVNSRPDGADSPGKSGITSNGKSKEREFVGAAPRRCAGWLCNRVLPGGGWQHLVQVAPARSSCMPPSHDLGTGGSIAAPNVSGPPGYMEDLLAFVSSMGLDTMATGMAGSMHTSIGRLSSSRSRGLHKGLSIFIPVIYTEGPGGPSSHSWAARTGSAPYHLRGWVKKPYWQGTTGYDSRFLHDSAALPLLHNRTPHAIRGCIARATWDRLDAAMASGLGRDTETITEVAPPQAT